MDSTSSPLTQRGRLPAAVTDVVAFLVAIALFAGIAWLKGRLLAARPFGLPVQAAPYAAYASGFALLGLVVTWRAAQLERAEAVRPVDGRALLASCVGLCVLVGLSGAWLFG